MKKNGRRTPKNYDGTGTTSHRVADLLSSALSSLSDACQERPDLLLAAWPEIIGPKHVAMTEAISFCEGILTVRIKNSSLYSLLSQHEKPRILAAIQKRFPKANVHSIMFRIG